MTATRRTRGPAADTRDRLINGTLQCLREYGEAGTTVAAISRASGLSRPTIYAHFNTLEDLIHQAVEDAALELSDRILRQAARSTSAAESIVEYVVAAHREFKADPVVALVVHTSLLPGIAETGTITPHMLNLSREPMRAALAANPEALARLDEIIETMVRFLLSVLTYSSAHTRSDDALRAYLHRTLVPALGLG
ncbi:MAG: TetR/AcrR family transcriptional regulator [Marmoricola sp.]